MKLKKKKSIYSLNLNYSDFISLKLIDSNRVCTFLVDSQAGISIIKISCIKSETFLDTSEKVTITGVTTQSIPTLDTIHTKLIFQNHPIPQTFYVVHDTFNITTEGILGKDFLKSNRCKISYDNMSISFWRYNKHLNIPIEHGTGNENCVIPPRCEVFRIFRLRGLSEPVFIDSQEICDGVYASKCIEDSETPVLRIINAKNEFKYVKIYLLKFEKLSNFNIYTVDKVNQASIRVQELNNVLENQMPSDVKNILIPLCEKYADVFALKNDKMTTNNFYEQKLRVSDSSPIYVKNYRIPYSQKEEVDRQVTHLLRNDLIEPSQSNYNSPLILVPKKV